MIVDELAADGGATVSLTVSMDGGVSPNIVAGLQVILWPASDRDLRRLVRWKNELPCSYFYVSFLYFVMDITTSPNSGAV